MSTRDPVPLDGMNGRRLLAGGWPMARMPSPTPSARSSSGLPVGGTDHAARTRLPCCRRAAAARDGPSCRPLVMNALISPIISRGSVRERSARQPAQQPAGARRRHSPSKRRGRFGAGETPEPGLRISKRTASSASRTDHAQPGETRTRASLLKEWQRRVSQHAHASWLARNERHRRRQLAAGERHLFDVVHDDEPSVLRSARRQ